MYQLISYTFLKTQHFINRLPLCLTECHFVVYDERDKATNTILLFFSLSPQEYVLRKGLSQGLVVDHLNAHLTKHSTNATCHTDCTSLSNEGAPQRLLETIHTNEAHSWTLIQAGIHSSLLRSNLETKKKEEREKKLRAC